MSFEALTIDGFKSLAIRPKINAAYTFNINTRISLRKSCVSDMNPLLPVNNGLPVITHDSKPTENSIVPNIVFEHDKNK